jgi:hypothetical protein
MLTFFRYKSTPGTGLKPSQAEVDSSFYYYQPIFPIIQKSSDLLRNRSPLLTESRLIYKTVTEMFQFTAL